jgi:glutamine synthetase
LEARNEIQLENYILKLQIEARLISEIAMNMIIPVGVSYQNKLMQNAKSLKELELDNAHVVSVITKINGLLSTIQTKVTALNEERGEVNKIDSSHDRAIAYCDRIKAKYFDEIRNAVDKLELIVDDDAWPLLKYREMLFLR